jgi:hypothetical protein
VQVRSLCRLLLGMGFLVGRVGNDACTEAAITGAAAGFAELCMTRGSLPPCWACKTATEQALHHVFDLKLPADQSVSQCTKR